jgi:hypothetical protein
MAVYGFAASTLRHHARGSVRRLSDMSRCAACSRWSSRSIAPCVQEYRWRASPPTTPSSAERLGSWPGRADNKFARRVGKQLRRSRLRSALRRGSTRDETEFRVAFAVSDIGTFGTLKCRECIFWSSVPGTQPFRSLAVAIPACNVRRIEERLGRQAPDFSEAIVVGRPFAPQHDCRGPLECKLTLADSHGKLKLCPRC